MLLNGQPDTRPTVPLEPARRESDDGPRPKPALPSSPLDRRRLPDHVKQAVGPLDEEVRAVRCFVVHGTGDPPRHRQAGRELGPSHLRPRIGERDLGVGERALQVAR